MSEQSIQELVADGELRKAAECLDRKSSLTLWELALRASLEFQTGEPSSALKLAESLLAATSDPVTRIRALVVKARSLGRLGSTDKEVALLQKAISQAAPVDAFMEADLRGAYVNDLLSLIGVEPVLAELPRLRESALKSGNNVALAKLHIANARVEALRAPSSRVAANLDRAEHLLAQSPNAEVMWFIQHVRTGVTSMEGRAGEALTYARDCLAQARASTAKTRVGYALGNLANIQVLTGAFSEAREALEECLALLPHSSLARFAALHTGIHLALLTGDESLGHRMIEDGQRTAELADADRSSYRLWFELHRLKWSLRSGPNPDVITSAAAATALATRLADKELNDRFLLLAAEACLQQGRTSEAVDFLDRGCVRTQPVTLPYLIELHRVAGILASSKSPEDSRWMLNAAKRVAISAKLLGLGAELNATTKKLRLDSLDASLKETTRATLNSVALILCAGRHPMTLGLELHDLLIRTGEFSWAHVVEEKDGLDTIVSSPNAGERLDCRRKSQRSIHLGAIAGATYRFYGPTEGSAGVLLWAAIQRIVDAATALPDDVPSIETTGDSWFETTPTYDSGMVVAADKSHELLRTTRKLAPSNITVLITGETGTGKELFARALHDSSPRSEKPFIPFNCSAVSKEMLDAQLFGYRKGAFTGAAEAFQGVIRAAAGGTLFLDEIGEVALDVQPKLLRFLESGEIHPLGEPRPIPVDVRVVAATNANLEQLVEDGRFREDLFYRLNVVRLHVPPLRERREEIPPLVQHYLERCSRESQKTSIRLADETMEYLILYKWPGNVRQLANEIRRMVALAESSAVLMPEHLSHDIAASRRTIPASERYIAPTEFVVRMDQPMSAAMEHLERSMIQYAMKLSGGRVEDAAERLGLSRKGLYLKRQRLALQDATAEGRSAVSA